MKKRTHKKRSSTKRMRVSVPAVRRAITLLAEKKHYTFSLAGSTSTTGVWQIQTCFFQGGPAQGVAVNQRVGNKIYLSRIDFRVVVEPTIVAGDSNGANCRFIVYHNKECNGSVITYGDLFETNEMNAFRNMDRIAKVNIMYDGLHQMAIVSGTVNTNPTKFINFSVFPKKRIDFIGNTNLINDILKDDYGFGFCSDGAACCKVSCEARLVYTDA